MNAFKRLENSARLLADHIESVRRKPFVWGEHDCCLFAAGAIHAITGEDVGAPWRGKYDSALSAARALKGVAIDEIPASVGLLPLKSKSLARRGDIVLIRASKHGPSLGVCLGSDCAFVGGADGLSFIPLSACARAWRVG